MLKKHPIIKRTLFVILTFIVLTIAFGIWFFSLLPKNNNYDAIKKTQPQDLVYLSQGIQQNRGKILAVVTSTDKMGSSDKRTGFELTELARAYYVFKANGFDVDISSPKGGKPPVVIDGDDMGIFDYAFLNDQSAQDKVNHSIAIAQVDPTQYQAIYFVGGKGAMFDFPQNIQLQSIVSNFYQSGKVVGAVCHGPAALVNVLLDDGTHLVANKKITGFTNDEELLLIPEAEDIFPFLLQSQLEEHGAKFSAGHVYLEQIEQDGHLVTGQNPWSVWAVAESMIEQLGYTPVKREITAEENTIQILITYENQGYQSAKMQINAMQKNTGQPVDRILLAMHSIVAAMQFDLGKFYDLVKLLAVADIDNE